MTVKAVIFDIGNVLIEWQPERFYDAEIGEARRKAMFAAVDLHGMNELVDLGHEFRDTVYEWAEKFPEWREEIRWWHDRWLEVAGPVIPQSVRLLNALQANGVPVFSLTNFGIGSFEVARAEWPFLNDFDRPYVSGHMKLTKPSAEIYAAVEADCGLPPQSLLFADDRAENCAAAAARGWQVHQFVGPEAWARVLVDAGLLTEDQAQ